MVFAIYCEGGAAPRFRDARQASRCVTRMEILRRFALARGQHGRKGILFGGVGNSRSGAPPPLPPGTESGYRDSGAAVGSLSMTPLRVEQQLASEAKGTAIPWSLTPLGGIHTRHISPTTKSEVLRWASRLGVRGGP